MIMEYNTFNLIGRNERFYVEAEMQEHKVVIYVEHNGESLAVEIKDGVIKINGKEMK